MRLHIDLGFYKSPLTSLIFQSSYFAPPLTDPPGCSFLQPTSAVQSVLAFELLNDTSSSGKLTLASYISAFKSISLAYSLTEKGLLCLDLLKLLK